MSLKNKDKDPKPAEYSAESECSDDEDKDFADEIIEVFVKDFITGSKRIDPKK